MDKYIRDDKDKDGSVDKMKYLNPDIDDDQCKEQIHEVDRDQLTQNDGIPKDEGWAWFVLLGATLVMLLQLGIVKSAGILFVAFQEKFNSSSSQTSLLSTVQNICQSITAFLVMTCGIKITTYRNWMFVGSSISCMAYIITSQATDIRVLLFSHGVVQGVGVGISLPVTVTMVSLYFEKRRGLANSIAVSGGPVGGVIFASIITRLLQIYGYQGCVLLLAGILLNGCVSGALFRSTSFYTTENTRHKQKDDEDENGENKKLFKDYEKHVPCYLDVVTSREDELIIDREFLDEACELTYEEPSGNLEHRKQYNISNESIVKGQNSFENFENTETTLQFADVKVSMKNVSIAKTTKNRNDCIGLMRYYISKYFNFKLLTNPLFLAFLLQGSLIASGTLVAPIFLIPYARDINITADDLATLVTSQSCIDLVARLLIGYISDKKWIRRSTIVATSSMVVAVSSSFLRFYTTFSFLLGYSIVLGLVSGTYFSLYTVVLIDYLTLENFQTSLGFMSLAHGFSIAGVFYLVGYIRDISGTYIVPYQVIGATTGIGAIIMYMMPVIQRLQKKK